MAGQHPIRLLSGRGPSVTEERHPPLACLFREVKHGGPAALSSPASLTAVRPEGDRSSRTPPAVTALLPPTEPGAHMEEDGSAAGGLTSRPAEAGAARAPQRRPGGKGERPPLCPSRASVR